MKKYYPIKHVAGIIPIASSDNFFNMPWDDCLMPLGNDYTAIEHAVFTCALAGCDTIWIVGHMEMQPLVRKTAGEMIYDPITVFSKPELNFYRHDKSFTEREIQIYYVPIHPKDRDKRDSLAFSILHGCYASMDVSSQISTWAKPTKFFCCFPYGIVNQEIIYEARKYIGTNQNTLISYNNKTILDGLMLPFTLDLYDYRRCIERVKRYSSSVWEGTNSKSFEALKFSLEEVFIALDTSQQKLLECELFSEIKNWDLYKQFLISSTSDRIKKYNDLWLTNKRKTMNFGE